MNQPENQPNQSSKFDLVTLGDLVADLIVPIERLPIQAQQHQVVPDIILEAGGSGNTLIMAARLGMQAKALGTVGDDYYGREVLALLAEEGVDVADVVTTPGSRTTTSLVLVDKRAEHVFIGMFGPGIPHHFDPGWGEIVSQASSLLVTGYALHDSSTFTQESVLACLDIAQQESSPIFFDLGPAAALVDPETVAEVVARSTVLLATVEEAFKWTGLTDPLQSAHAILAHNPELVILKLGERGCLVAVQGHHVHVPAFPVIVRDTAGAGDAFAAACVYAYLRDYPLERLGLLANAVGAATVACFGTGTRLPGKQDVVDVLEIESFQWADF